MVLEEWSRQPVSLLPPPTSPNPVAGLEQIHHDWASSRSKAYARRSRHRRGQSRFSAAARLLVADNWEFIKLGGRLADKQNQRKEQRAADKNR